MMDWMTFAQLWGPAVPMFAVFVFYLHRLIFKTVPRGLSRLKQAVETLDEKSQARHDEAMAAFARVEAAMVAVLNSRPGARFAKPVLRPSSKKSSRAKGAAAVET